MWLLLTSEKVYLDVRQVPALAFARHLVIIFQIIWIKLTSRALYVGYILISLEIALTMNNFELFLIFHKIIFRVGIKKFSHL